jgi:hypothetical protein
MSNVPQLVSEPQNKYEYVFPQDIQTLRREIYVLATLESLSDCRQNSYLISPLIADKALQKCNGTKENCKHEAVCNDIQAFDTFFIRSYIECYAYVQTIYYRTPQAFEAILKVLDTPGPVDQPQLLNLIGQLLFDLLAQQEVL